MNISDLDDSLPSPPLIVRWVIALVVSMRCAHCISSDIGIIVTSPIFRKPFSSRGNNHWE